jgi:hypothetical protein
VENGAGVEDMGSCIFGRWKGFYAAVCLQREAEDFEYESNMSVAVEDGFAQRWFCSPSIAGKCSMARRQW